MDYYLSPASSLIKPFIGRRRAGVENPISAISINPMPELSAIAKCIPKAEANKPARKTSTSGTAPGDGPQSMIEIEFDLVGR